MIENDDLNEIAPCVNNLNGRRKVITCINEHTYQM